MFYMNDRRKKENEKYDVYFLEDYVQTFNTLKEAKQFIKESVKFDKEENNPFGAKASNYSIEVIEED